MYKRVLFQNVSHYFKYNCLKNGTFTSCISLLLNEFNYLKKDNPKICLLIKGYFLLKKALLYDVPLQKYNN